VVRRDCTDWHARIEADVPSVVVRAHDPDGHDVVNVRVFVDDKQALSQLDGRPLELNPGRHALRYEAGGYAPAEEAVLIALGEKNRTLIVTLQRGAGAPPAAATSAAAGPPSGTVDSGIGTELPKTPVDKTPAEPHSSTPSGVVAGYGLLGVGAAAVASFTVFEILGQDEYSNLHNGCAQTHSCSQSSVDSAQSKFVGAGISLGMAAAAVGAGGILLLTTRRPTKGVTVEIGPGTLRARLTF
jgi:hypothetical protein